MHGPSKSTCMLLSLLLLDTLDTYTLLHELMELWSVHLRIHMCHSITFFFCLFFIIIIIFYFFYFFYL